MVRVFPLMWVLITACDSNKGSLAPPPSVDGKGTMPTDGCISINDEGGFVTIADALDWAEEGDSISLCSETYSERVIVNKGVTIKGPTSGGPAIIDNPEEASAVTIRADGVTLSWLTIKSPGRGVHVDAVDGTNLRVLTLAETGDNAIRVKGGTDVLLQSSSFGDIDGSAVYIDEGGSIRVVNSLFDRLSGYVTVADSGATLSLEGNEFFDTQANEEGRAASARVNNGSYLYSTSNLYSDDADAAILSSDSTIQSIGDTFQGGTHAIKSTGGPITVDSATVTHPTVTGIRVLADDSDVSITNSTFTADPAGHAMADVETWAAFQADEGVAIYAKGSSVIRMENLSVSGFNHGGIYIGGSGGAPVETNLTSLNITNVGWHGLNVRDAEATVTDTTISDIHVHESKIEALCATVGDYGGATFRSSAVDWVGGGASDVSGTGIAGLESSLVFSGIDVHDNACAGVMNFQGSVAVDDSDFTAPSTDPLGASIVSYSGTASSVTNSRFVDSFEVAESSTSGSESFLYVYYDRVGADIQAWYGGDLTVSGNTFTSGARGVYGNGANLTLSDNSWTDYGQYGALVVEGELTMTSNTFSSSAGHAAACINGTMSINDLTVDTTLTSEDRSYEIWSYGEVMYPSSPANSNYPAIFTEGCDSTMSNTALNDIAAMAIRLYGGTHELSELTVLRSNSAGFITDAAIDVYDNWIRDGVSYVEDAHVTLSNSSISQTGDGGGIAFTRYSFGTDEPSSSLTISGSSLTEIGDVGVSAVGADLSVSDTNITNAGRAGVLSNNGNLTMSNVTVDGAGSSGIQISSSTAVLDAVTAQYSGYSGIWVSAGNLTLTNSFAKNNAQNGVQVDMSTASLTENTLTDNSGYGLSCTGATILACDNLYGGNALGPTDACWDACTGIDPPVDDTEDTGDTDTGEPDTGAPDTGEASAIDPTEDPEDTGAAPEPEDTGVETTLVTGI